ncbi:MAG: PEP-CTERM sorting domain-containing protein [Rhodoferax sp.]|nr:PEP-CTERM sorting domain-containing protein [Rhodoferax sp.]
MSLRSWADAVGVVMVAVATSAHAVDLTGETLTFHRLYPDILTTYGEPFSPATVTVVAGPDDDTNWIELVYVSPEATTISFSIPFRTGWEGGGEVFDGFAVSGFSFDPSSAYLVSNTTGRNVELSFAPDMIYIDLVDNYPDFLYQGTFVIGFPVPEPATWGLFGAGLAALGWRARRRC